MQTGNLTPMMKQFFEVKRQYSDCILFYRLGDFYEMFFEDAKTASRELELTLTGRDCGCEERAPMCGVPYHAADGYIARLIAKGYKVAICEQTEDPSAAKGLVRREVVRVVTPGTLTDEKVLEGGCNNYLACICTNGQEMGLAFTDFSTGELYATCITEDLPSRLCSELSRFNPTEIVTCKATMQKKELSKILNHAEGCFVNAAAEQEISLDQAGKIIKEHFKGKEAKDFGVPPNSLAAISVAMVLLYIADTQKTGVEKNSHIHEIKYYTVNEYMDIDPGARRSLELTQTMRQRAKKGSLLWVLDNTTTAMGARMLRRWLEKPLLDCDAINLRLEAVEEFVQSMQMREDAREILKDMRDLERLIGRVVCKSANARDLIAMKLSLQQLPSLLRCLSSVRAPMNVQLTQNFDLLKDICSLIEMGVHDEPPLSLRDGGLIKLGYHEEVDRLRRAVTEGKGWLADIEKSEKEKTGIKSLKVGFNKVFGYYIEVSNSYVSKVPEDYIRKQTLTGGERYITPKLKEIESLVLGAEEKIVAEEYRLFCEIRDKVEEVHRRMQETASTVATIDTLLSLAYTATKYHYHRPIVDKTDQMIIRDGRHPVVERMIDDMFVPNDTHLNCKEDRLAIITGPNMAGKSTYMRQIALISLMAQMGSFVPCAFAHIGVVDKLFARVGASDDLAAGQSTFMVEMSEVAYILKNATARSLIIFDEIGRGTSTYDGLSIAWAVLEYVADIERLGARTLFATHYHELTQLEDKVDGVKNYCIAVKERGEDIVFLRKIIKGGADDSYGIEVAKLAGVPQYITKRAKEILAVLEEGEGQQRKQVQIKATHRDEPDEQTEIYCEIARQIDGMDLNTLSPIEAMNILFHLKKRIQEKGE